MLELVSRDRGHHSKSCGIIWSIPSVSSMLVSRPEGPQTETSTAPATLVRRQPPDPTRRERGRSKGRDRNGPGLATANWQNDADLALVYVLLSEVGQMLIRLALGIAELDVAGNIRRGSERGTAWRSCNWKAGNISDFLSIRHWVSQITEGNLALHRPIVAVGLVDRARRIPVGNRLPLFTPWKRRKKARAPTI
jgi:hypothetical protein